MTDTQRKLAAYRRGNLEAARIVAADPERYSGLMQEWAALVLSRAEKTTIDTPVAGPLFKTEAA